MFSVTHVRVCVSVVCALHATCMLLCVVCALYTLYARPSMRRVRVSFCACAKHNTHIDFPRKHLTRVPIPITHRNQHFGGFAINPPVHYAAFFRSTPQTRSRSDRRRLSVIEERLVRSGGRSLQQTQPPAFLPSASPSSHPSRLDHRQAQWHHVAHVVVVARSSVGWTTQRSAHWSELHIRCVVIDRFHCLQEQR